jgi:hypothetical protein
LPGGVASITNSATASTNAAKRAIEHGNLIRAEGMAREVGNLTLSEALHLVALIAQKDRARRSRCALRWLRRLLDEDESLTVDEAVFAAAALASLGGRGPTSTPSRPFQAWQRERLASRVGGASLVLSRRAEVPSAAFRARAAVWRLSLILRLDEALR